MPNPNPNGDHLPRLSRHLYQGHAAIHWQSTLQDRAAGWLTDLFHARFREILLHTAHRESLICPAYCLMPDHIHLVWIGLRLESDQRNAMKFLREHINRELEHASANRQPHPPGDDTGWRLQKQAYDHILRHEERQRAALQAHCDYIRMNPVRASLVRHDLDWPFTGCIAPGYPALHPGKADSWEIFWRVHDAARNDETLPSKDEKPKLHERLGDARLR